MSKWSGIVIVLALCSGRHLRSQGDPVRAAQASQQALLDTTQQNEKDLQRRQAIEKLRFEMRFREFVKAMNAFIERYNVGNGQVWPQHEAEKLGKAMRGVQGSFQPPHKPKEQDR